MRINKWTDRPLDRRINRRTDRRINRRTDRRINRRTERRIKYIDGTDRPLNRQNAQEALSIYI